ncbi:MAG TPA: hypothetical protein VGO73_04875 [Pyrinomonadaceae bacterium]|nr:hypothetical protein [Pyrinomonadaceae bacterium]
MAEAPPPSASTPVDQPQQISKLPPPDLNQVQEAVKRVFKESVLIDTSRNPAFITGDFNGDLSEDVAVVLKPAAEKLSDLNDEFPNWILRDLSGSKETGTPRLKVTADEVLLAVIHGYGPSGWRDPQATQTFLLKNAVGPALTTHSAKDFAAANQGNKVPQLRGDVVREELGGTPGYLYFAGATYSWYDPKTFKDDPEVEMMRSPHGQKVKK